MGTAGQNPAAKTEAWTPAGSVSVDSGFVKISDAADDVGVVIPSGYGDGTYPVYVRKTPEGRVAEVKVTFIIEEAG